MRGGGSGQRERRTPDDQGNARRASQDNDHNLPEDDDLPPAAIMTPEPEPEEPLGEETIMLEASFPPPGGYPEEEEEEEGEDEEEEDEDAIELVVETLVGDTYRVRISQKDTATGLKALLYRTLGIASSHQRLLLGEKELLDDIYLIEQGVRDGSVLTLVVAMTVGPINARRLPTQDDVLWSEITDYMIDNRQDLLDSVGGRTVTLLVLRDGENINLYRVTENQDGSFSPLNESWGSMGSGEKGEEDGIKAAQIAEENARTQARVEEIRARMDAMKMKLKNKNERAKLSSQKSLSSSTNAGLELQSEEQVVPQSNNTNPIRNGSSRPSTQRSDSGSKRRTSLTRWGGRGSRPTTQERDMRRRSISRASNRLKPLTNKSMGTVEVDFTRKKPLEGIRSNIDKNVLSAVDEEQGKGRNTFHPSDTANAVQQKKYDSSYRKSLVKHVMVSGTKAPQSEKQKQTENDTKEAWPRRDPSFPLYMPDALSGPHPHEAGRLNRSHNQELLRVLQRTPNTRPKTSPEVLERRPGSTGGQSTLSDRIHLRAPDDRLLEICTIFSSSRGNSRQSNRSVVSPPETVYPSLSTSLTGNSLSRSQKKKSVSGSMSSLRTNRTPPSPGPGALVASGSREQRDVFRDLMKNHTNSRRNTPQGSRYPVYRPGSGRLSSSQAHLPPVTPPRRGRREHKRPRCEQCRGKIGVATTHQCRCGGIFCPQHRYAETHACTFDYRTQGREMIRIANPTVAPPKLPKI